MIEETIATTLSNYGVLGLWTLVLLAEKFFNLKTTKKVIENNTIAVTKVYEVMQKCEKR